MGFADECRQKLGEDPDKPDSVFQQMCNLFEYLPIAASINDKIFCVHSGISENLKIEDLNAIKKPYKTNSSKIISEALWSQPNIYKEEYLANNYTTQFRKMSFYIRNS